MQMRLFVLKLSCDAGYLMFSYDCLLVLFWIQQPSGRMLFAQPVIVPGEVLLNGTCNSMPGWDPMGMWNPTDYHSDPDCRLNPMYNERGMGASYGGQYH
ncbi:hypothetical protein GUITHDRAFT_113730 [Guillardia theta CCMP2712]|uniref:Uncharacterized protein n=1 Tax=Guillardia theta (strain CCMP2712) TaxID=905079 RepID=L1IVX4_GUITC|nr:hypothetical protein GUITHDRAFT_113730 [Guillardia theta CCMP2712]EKX40252.1 hypothetical protein GUITHDRAFT_113730 [Guillardia theta CCMP2712]|eukprot:XP_005827232.1 hypothetical protein GUITHDRAFT_113730 [Guillardia theta CCMP2712]